MLDAVSKGVLAVKLCFNAILQFWTADWPVYADWPV